MKPIVMVPSRLRVARRMLCALAFLVLALLGGTWAVHSALASRHYRAELARAEMDFRAGFAALAQTRLSALAVRWPDDPEVLFRLGICELARGRREAALAAWSRVPLESAFGPQAAALRGYELTTLGHYSRAEAVLDAAERVAEPPPYELSRALIRLYMYEGRIEDARRLTVASWSQSPDPAATLKQLWTLDTTALPLDGWRRALEKADAEDDRVWLGRASLATFSGRFDEAGPRLAACRKSRPDDPAVWRAQLRLARAIGDPEAVWQAAMHVPAGVLTESEVLDLRAWLASRRGDIDSERRALADLVRRSPGEAQAWERLAALASHAGDATEVQRLHERKAELDRAVDRYRKIVLYEADLVSRAGELARLAETLGRPFDARAWSLLQARSPAARGPIGVAITLDEPGDSAVRKRGGRLADLLADLHLERSVSPASVAARPVFADEADKVGLRFTYNNGETPRREVPETMAGGVAVLDYDGDGWLDVYVVQGGPLDGSARHPDGDHLFRNESDGTFRDVTVSAGIATLPRSFTLGVAVGDYDGDGKPDLFLSRLRSYALLRNRGDGTFEDATEVAGLSGLRDNPSSAAFADLDNDGDLDLYVCHYMLYDPDHPRLCQHENGGYLYCDPSKLDPAPDHVFRNDGGRFVDVTSQSGFVDPDGRGLGVVAADLDDDNRIDLCVANDGTANYLFHNLGDFRFEEVAHAAGVAAGADGGYHAGMGITCGDLNGDGRPDLVITNFYGEASAYYQNLGGGAFTDRTVDSGLGAATRYLLGFGTSFFDYDNDGRLDLLTANGHVNDNRPFTPYGMPVQLLAGDGKGHLTDVSAQAGPPWNVLRVARGLATADLDNDGCVDALVLEQNKPLAYFHNRTPGGHFLTLRLEGTSSNRDGVGARVAVVAGGRRQVGQRTGGGSYQSACDPRLHFGLAGAMTVDRIDVRWPSGREERYEALPADTGYLLREGSGRAHPLPGFAPALPGKGTHGHSNAAPTPAS